MTDKFNLLTEQVHEQNDTQVIAKPKHPTLNEKYTFDKFVTGDNNAFAYNAAISVSNNPGKAYNPLLILGNVGLGKTHLMQPFTIILAEKLSILLLKILPMNL